MPTAPTDKDGELRARPDQQPHRAAPLPMHLMHDGAPGGQRLYTVAEACQLLRISRWSLYQLINRRELRSITIGSRRLIAADDFDRYVADRQREAEL